MTPSSTEMHRVLQAQAGDRAALDALLRSIEQPLFAYVAGVVGRGPLAEDVLQDVFVLVYRKLTWLRDPALFRPWVYRLASRECFCALRHITRRAETFVDAAELDAIGDAHEPDEATRALVARLPDALTHVPPGSRAALLLHYAHDLSLAETAEVLGLPVGTVKSRVAYGLAAMRRALDITEA